MSVPSVGPAEKVIRSLHAQIRRLERVVEALQSLVLAQRRLLVSSNVDGIPPLPEVDHSAMRTPEIEEVIAALKELSAL